MNSQGAQVVAHYSFPKAALWTSGFIGLAIFLVHAVLQEWHLHTYKDHIGAIAGTAIFIPLSMWLVCFVYVQVLFFHSRAVWLLNGFIVFLDYYGGIGLSRAPVDEIEKVNIERIFFWRPKGVVFTLYDGGKYYIPTLLLREKKEVVRDTVAEIARVAQAGGAAHNVTTTPPA